MKSRLFLLVLIVFQVSCSGVVSDEKFELAETNQPNPKNSQLKAENVTVQRALKRISSFEKMDFQGLFLTGSLDRAGKDLSQNIFFKAYSRNLLPEVESKKILVAENVEFNVVALLIELGAEVTMIVSKFESDNDIQSYFTKTGYSSVNSVTKEELLDFRKYFDQVLVKSVPEDIGATFLNYYGYLGEEFVIVIEEIGNSTSLKLLQSSPSGLSSLALAVR